MAKYEQRVVGDLQDFVAHLDATIQATSATGKLENSSEFTLGDARLVVRVYERYSAMGGNRVSLTMSVLAVEDQLMVSAITSGGSTAMLWKVNTWGEETFLEKAVQAIQAYAGAT